MAYADRLGLVSYGLAKGLRVAQIERFFEKQKSRLTVVGISRVHQRPSAKSFACNGLHVTTVVLILCMKLLK